MPVSLLYYITDRTAFATDESTRRRRLVEKISEAARVSVDYIQIREKDLSTRELEALARDAVSAIREARRLATDHRQLATAVFINSRTDVALAAGADGVHLRSDDASPQDVREMWKECGASSTGQLSPLAPLIAVSCHSPAEVTEAAENRANLAVFGPVFEEKGLQPVGLKLLREACKARIPVLALGGVTLADAHACLEAGAAGIAAIRLFQENDIATVVKQLRG
jgi:thiamine-phosphate pyrophosphorylase